MSSAHLLSPRGRDAEGEQEGLHREGTVRCNNRLGLSNSLALICKRAKQSLNALKYFCLILEHL